MSNKTVTYATFLVDDIDELGVSKTDEPHYEQFDIAMLILSTDIAWPADSEYEPIQGPADDVNGGITLNDTELSLKIVTKVEATDAEIK